MKRALEIQIGFINVVIFTEGRQKGEGEEKKKCMYKNDSISNNSGNCWKKTWRVDGRPAVGMYRYTGRGEKTSHCQTLLIWVEIKGSRGNGGGGDETGGAEG